MSKLHPFWYLKPIPVYFVVNGGFEDGTTGWTGWISGATRVQDYVHSGLWSLREYVAGHYVQQNWAAIPKTAIKTFEFWARAEVGGMALIKIIVIHDGGLETPKNFVVPYSYTWSKHDILAAIITDATITNLEGIRVEINLNVETRFDDFVGIACAKC